MPRSDEPIDALLEEALRFSNRQERDHWLVAACGDDNEKLRELRSLILASEKTVFLDTPLEAVEQGQRLLQSLAGTWVGPFELIRQIGQGGMGVVYLAQQSQPISRLVAIKLIQRDLENRAMLKRFQIEQQTLADMDHPNIARIIDAGETASGLLYIAMEYVQGEQLLDYCRKNQPSIRLKVNLMRQCCRAIQHAHQKGTIHRDIKPSNVMVTLVNNEPVVKVIDFGIAKALSCNSESIEPDRERIHGHEIENTTQTRTLTGTPFFMSPEQYSSRNQRVDTRSDIYALGALFYTLLTGTAPYDSSVAKGKSISEIREIVLKNPPPHPSQRAPASARILRGDLDAIVTKAMQRDPESRYQSVEQLHDDLRCYLEDYPVSANQNSSWINIRKFSRRNKMLLATSLLGFLGLCAGLVIAIVEKKLAVESERMTKEQSFASEMLLSSMAINQNNYAMAKGILERSSTSAKAYPVAITDHPKTRLDWRLLSAKIPVEPTTLAHFPTKIYYALSLPTRNEIACGCKDSHLRVLHCGTGKVRLDIDTAQGEINGLALSPDNKQIASGGDDGTVKVWSTETGYCLGAFQASSKGVFQLGWSADGKHLVTAGIEPDAVVWSIPDFEMVRRLDSAREPLECLAINKLGDVIYGSSKGIVRIGSLDPKKSETIQRVAISNSRAMVANRCSTVVASPSGRFLAAGLDNGYLILMQKSADKYLVVEQIRFKTTVTAIAFDRDESRIALGEDSGSLHVLNLYRNLPTRSRLVFTKFFYDSNNNMLDAGATQPSDLWSLVNRTDPVDAKDNLPLDCDRVYLEFKKPLLNITFPENYLLDCIDDSGQADPSWSEVPTEVRIKDDGIEIQFENRFGGWQTSDKLHARGRIQTWASHSRRIANVLWSEDESAIYSASEDGNVNCLRPGFLGENAIARTNHQFLPLTGNKLLITLTRNEFPSMMQWNGVQPNALDELQPPIPFTSFAGVVNDNRENLLICGQEASKDSHGVWSIFRWGLNNQKVEKLSQFPETVQPHLVIGTIDQDRIILTYRDLLKPQPEPVTNFSMGCWDIKRSIFLWYIPAINKPIRFHKISPMKGLFSFVKEREVFVVNSFTGEQSSLSNFPDTPVTCTSFSTDDRYLAVATSDRKIFCFRTDNHTIAWTLNLPGSAASDVFWSSDRKTLATVSRDGFLRTFDIALQQMTSEIRLSIADPITIRSAPEENSLYILGLDGTILRIPCSDPT